MKDDLAKFVKITNAFILWPSNHDSRYLFSVHYFTHAKWRYVQNYLLQHCNNKKYFKNSNGGKQGTG